MSSGLKRDTIDKYYTNHFIVDEIIKIIKTQNIINKNDLIIEPSAGNGAFINGIKSLSNHYLFYDIEPEHKEIIKQDFLNLDLTNIIKQYNNIHIIGNPPFGRQSTTAIKFIKKCCLFSKSISIILPKSFKKDTLKDKFDLHYHLLYEIDLEKLNDNSSFILKDTFINVPCVFQIWIKKDILRMKQIKLKPNNFNFVKKTEDFDLAFRRVGVNAGYVETNKDNFEALNVNCFYFIKINEDVNTTDFINKIKTLHFDFNNTVGPKSISKQELISKMNE